MRLGDDQKNPHNISNLTAIKMETMSYDSKVPEFLANPDTTKNPEFIKSLSSQILKKIYDCDDRYEIAYKIQLRKMMIAIGTHRVESESYESINFKLPDSGKEIDAFNFIKMHIEIPEELPYESMPPQQ